MRKAKEDPDLTEVRAVLQRLQRLDLSENVTGQGTVKQAVPTKVGKNPPVPANQAGIDVFDRKRNAIEAHGSARKAGRPALWLLGLLVFASCAVALFATGTVTVQQITTLLQGEKPLAVQPEADELVVLADARRLMSEGDITLARTRLLKGGPENRAELAFMLAQSYDPNYLRALAKANNIPDRAEAERWYKKWYELAVKSGLEMDSERLQRIIKAMK